MALSWYVCRSNIRCEEKARDSLKRLRYRDDGEDRQLVVYLPMEFVVRGRGKERRTIERPLISRHLFFGFHAGNPFEAVRDADGVESILSMGRFGPPQRVPPWALFSIQVAEGELEDEFRAKEAKRKASELAALRLAETGRPADDTDEFIVALKTAPADRRGEVVYSMLGRGARARLKLQDLQIVA